MSVQEQELYQKEGLGVNEVRYVDNQDCIGEFLGSSTSPCWPFKMCAVILITSLCRRWSWFSVENLKKKVSR